MSRPTRPTHDASTSLRSDGTEDDLTHANGRTVDTDQQVPGATAASTAAPPNAGTMDTDDADDAVDEAASSGGQQLSASRGNRVSKGLAAVAVVAALIIAATAGYLVGRPGAGAKPAAIDVGFLRDMTTHHQQAITMSTYTRDASTDPEVRAIAFDIDTAQSVQLGAMTGWLEQRSLSRTGGTPMSWMPAGAMRTTTGKAAGASTTVMSPGTSMGMSMGSGHSMSMGDSEQPGGVSMSSGEMPGMATAAQLDRLRGSRGTALDVLFLQLMIRHHQGGVMMSGYAASHASSTYVRNLAQLMYDQQSVEIVEMLRMLSDRGAKPLPAP